VWCFSGGLAWGRLSWGFKEVWCFSGGLARGRLSWGFNGVWCFSGGLARGRLSWGFNGVWCFSGGLARGRLSGLNNAGGGTFVVGIYPEGALSKHTLIFVVVQNFSEIGQSAAVLQGFN